MIRSNSGEDALTSVPAVPHISVADRKRLQLLNYNDRGIDPEIDFRNWELHEYPLLQQIGQHTWPITSARVV